MERGPARRAGHIAARCRGRRCVVVMRSVRVIRRVGKGVLRSARATKRSSSRADRHPHRIRRHSASRFAERALLARHQRGPVHGRMAMMRRPVPAVDVLPDVGRRTPGVRNGGTRAWSLLDGIMSGNVGSRTGPVGCLGASMTGRPRRVNPERSSKVSGYTYELGNSFLNCSKTSRQRSW